MAFTDDLTLILDLLILTTAVVFYTGGMVWFETRRNDLARANSHLREGAMLLGLLGATIGIVAIWGELTWPIQGFPGATSYDLFFFDPLVMLSLVLIAFALAVRSRYPTHFVGLFSVVAGLGVLFYGFRARQLNLTEEPLETFLMYLAFGTAALLAYPATLYLDWFVVGPTAPAADPLPSTATPRYPWLWRLLLGLFLLALILAGIAAVAYGVAAAWAHLASPP